MKRIRLHTKQTQSGFTLLEVLVALGIAATSLVALYTLANQLLKSATALDYRQAALWCADNHMIATKLAALTPPLGEASTNCKQLGVDFVLKRTVSTTPNPLFRRVEIAVYAADTTGAAGNATASTERLAFLASVMAWNSSPNGNP
jgi:general secretion pathway protein I